MIKNMLEKEGAAIIDRSGSVFRIWAKLPKDGRKFRKERNENCGSFYNVGRFNSLHEAIERVATSRLQLISITNSQG